MEVENDVDVSPAESAMNLERHTKEFIPVSPSLDHQQPVHCDAWAQILSPLVKNGGLANIPQTTLRQNLQPVVSALERLDAELLLDLQPAESGPRVREGRCCKPIYNKVEPTIAMGDGPDAPSCVRYLHISEVPDQYSIGIFVFAPYARIPLHDHPDMCVLSRVLYGDLQRLSLDLVREEDTPMSIDDSTEPNRNNSWLGGWLNSVDSLKRKLPEGSKHALRKDHIDHLRAPAVTVLYPYEGNLHEFVAGPDGAAVLDVLLPPYDNTQNRDCTFYEIHDMPSTWPKPAGKEPCFIVPTGQPESFHCISGRYKDIGEADDYDF
eukprot:CAMPEP_0116997174 /NCGR_PEP_ID=MMETSP0472-20121206/708_1 /TAXON_ID=693140 ORGANISM="Tiarina fusus, Strain LIS" /NCGR_SAMPLE_ID=MMETSP0472 /ASSEMBLY_ACC=CAM_ASM_000603 /LENGTH=321 /DNA_ID=CAMNT_0004695987 /DNA_START=132 /DNA_END=1097 /DNA_ORIENTATION=+